MKKQIKKDERVSILEKRILSESCIILMIILVISILVQQYLFHATFKQYFVEFICLFLISVYILIRNVMLGINIFEKGKSSVATSLLLSIGSGLLVTLIGGISNYIQYAQKYQDNLELFVATLSITFISAVIISFIIFIPFVFINHKKQNKMQKELDEQDN